MLWLGRDFAEFEYEFRMEPEQIPLRLARRSLAINLKSKATYSKWLSLLGRSSTSEIL